jgi:hypothetical protein
VLATTLVSWRYSPRGSPSRGLTGPLYRTQFPRCDGCLTRVRLLPVGCARQYEMITSISFPWLIPKLHLTVNQRPKFSGSIHATAVRQRARLRRGWSRPPLQDQTTPSVLGWPLMQAQCKPLQVAKRNPRTHTLALFLPSDVSVGAQSPTGVSLPMSLRVPIAR